MVKSYKDYLHKNSVLLVGNGVNLRDHAPTKVSWHGILKSMSPNGIIPEGYPLTEYFELLKNSNESNKEIKTKFIDSIKDLQSNHSHREIIDACVERNAVLMTSNFDHAFQKVGNFELSKIRNLNKGFTYYYPWQRFYLHGSGLRLWHINGDMRYKDSVKLSVMDYAGCLNYFRKFDPEEKGTRYRRDKTWINELFEKDLIIMGLSLSEVEIFIRHVLIRRNAYAKKKGLKIKGYFLKIKEDRSLSNTRLEFFLNNVGIEIVEYQSFDDMYG